MPLVTQETWPTQRDMALLCMALGSSQSALAVPASLPALSGLDSMSVSINSGRLRFGP